MNTGGVRVAPGFVTARVNTVDVALADMPEVLAWVDQVVAFGGASHVLNHVPAHPTTLARRDPAVREILDRADCNVADGMGVVWAARLLSGGDKPLGRVYGPDLMLEVCNRGQAAGWRHAFVGGTAEVLPRLLNHLVERFPRLQVAGAHAPPFRDVTPAGVAEDLDALTLGGQADVLWVGLGTPKQLVWADLARRHLPARLLVTVGAAFDFHAGLVAQAPAWMQDRGLEWAHRLVTDPRRLAHRYLVGNVRHVAGVLRDLPTARRARS